jgi:AcrR family transcriptional regulator
MVRTVKKPEARRAEIISSAAALFQTKGYENTSMQDVMVDLDIAKGTIYHYFKSKEDLFEAVIYDIVERVTLRMQGIVSTSEGNALQRLQQLILAGQVAAGKEEILAHLHSSANQIMHLRMLAVAIQQQAPMYAEILKQGVKEGLFTCEHPLECAEFILWSAQSLTDQGIFPWTDADMMRRGMAAPALLEALLHAPAGSFNFLIPSF